MNLLEYVNVSSYFYQCVSLVSCRDAKEQKFIDVYAYEKYSVSLDTYVRRI